jgi:hypothetical protein
MATQRATLYLVVRLERGMWANPMLMHCTRGRLTELCNAYESDNGAGSFRAFDVELNKGVRF